MKKLSKFLSLALTSASLLLPSTSAVRYISRADMGKFLDPEFADSYAREVRVDYENSTMNRNSEELKILKIRLGDVLKMLNRENPKLAVCLTVQLMKYFGIAHQVASPEERPDLYDADEYDEECAIVCAPTSGFGDIPVIVQLFRRHYFSSSLRIN